MLTTVVVVLSLGAACAWGVVIGPSAEPAWEQDAQVKVGWIFGDPQNPQNTGVFPGWDRYIGNQPVWDYDADRVVYETPGQWHIQIPNLDNDNPFKHFWLSFVYERDTLSEDLQSYINIDWSPFEDYANYVVNDEQWFDINGGPTTDPYLAVYGRMLVTVDMYPNPAYEDIWIGLNQGFDLREAYTITQCVPEPATVALLGLGSLAFLRKRRV